jgi:voltage-gated potassium channel
MRANYQFEYLLARLVRLDPVRMQIAAAFLVLLILFMVGTLVYGSVDGWSLVDGLYMTFLTLSTVGFEEIHPLSDGMRIFTVGLGVIGILAVGLIITRTAQVFVAGQRLMTFHMKNRIDRLDDHYIVCGYGRLGRRIAKDFHGAGKPFLIIDKDPAKLDALSKTPYIFLEGDAEEESVLIEAGIERAAGLVATLTGDSDNIFTTLIARELNPNLFILGRINSAKNARRLYRAGANKVISPYEIGADRMARVILRPNVDRFLEQALHVANLDLQVEEVAVYEDSPMAGMTLQECQFRNRFGAIIIGIVDDEHGHIAFNPSANTVLNGGDVLIILGDVAMISDIKKAFGTHESQ